MSIFVHVVSVVIGGGREVFDVAQRSDKDAVKLVDGADEDDDSLGSISLGASNLMS